MTPKRILILTSDAGFGHRSVSNAMEAVFREKLNGSAEVTIINPMQDPSLPEMVKSVETSYDSVVTEEPMLYQLYYTVTESPLVTKIMKTVTTAVLTKIMRRIIEDCQPESIVIPYPAYTSAVRAALHDLRMNVPVHIIVTDLVDVHKLWFSPDVTMTYAPTGYVYRQALDEGIEKTQVKLTGLPVHPRFANETRDSKTLRSTLGWETDKITALLVGSPREAITAETACLLDRSGLDLQLVVVSGGNECTDEKLQFTDWRGTVHTYGRVDNLHEMMKAADFIVCKAGGLIVSESLACGLPLILCQALPGQEQGNVRYVVENGAGAWSPGSVGVLSTIYAWLAGSCCELEERREAATRTGKPRAAYSVADHVLKL